MKKEIIEIIVGILILLFGILLGKLLDWSYFQLTREFNIIDALSLLTTVAIAIYITNILEKDVMDKNNRKNLFVNEILEVESMLRSIGILFEERDISVNKVAVRIYTCRERTTTLFQHIRNILVHDNNREVDNLTQLITDQLSRLFQLLTEAAPESSDQTGFTLYDDIICYSDDRTSEIRKAINGVGGNLFALKIWINNL